MAAANPQLVTPYHLPEYYPYFHQVPAASFYQPSFSPYYQAQHGSYVKPSFVSYFPELNHGVEESENGYEGEENPYAYALLFPCPDAKLMDPCSCSVTRKPGAPFAIGNINCPANLTAADTKKTLSRIPAGYNIQTVTLILRPGTNKANAVGSLFQLNYPQATITIANPTDGNTCVDSSLLAPCTCEGGTITCPSTIAPGSIVPGSAADQLKAIFSNIAPNTNLGDVVIRLPGDAGDVAIPANMLGSSTAKTIQVISAAATNALKLTIDAAAFTSSASTATAFTITNFDLINVDYSFLANFNLLTTLNLKTSKNVPTKAKPPTNLSTLPVLSKGQNVLVDGVPYERVCPAAASLTPCTCDGSGLQAKTTCPAGTTLAQIQDVFNKLPANSNLGDVVLNFPAGAATSIPQGILGSNAAFTIEVIGPTGTASTLSIDAASFTQSATSATQFTITSFDVANVNYGFLANFNALVNVNIKTCTNSPTALNQMPTFPTNLNSFKGVIVDGNTIA